jgi:hypothetical protein
MDIIIFFFIIMFCNSHKEMKLIKTNLIAFKNMEIEYFFLECLKIVNMLTSRNTVNYCTYICNTVRKVKVKLHLCLTN